jgi:hypothetical protein
MNSGIRHSESSDDSHYANGQDDEGEGEDDEDPRPVKRRKLPLMSTKVLTSFGHRLTPRLTQPHSLTPSSTTEPEIDDSQSLADQRLLPTSVDNQHHLTPRPSQSPSPTPLSPTQHEIDDAQS